MDESLAVGDMEFQQKCMDVLSQYRKDGVTIVFVSHDSRAVRRFCDKTLLLNKGKQVVLGNTGEVLDRDADGGGNQALNSSEKQNESKIAEIEVKLTTLMMWEDKEIEITNVKFTINLIIKEPDLILLIR